MVLLLNSPLPLRFCLMKKSVFEQDQAQKSRGLQLRVMPIGAIALSAFVTVVCGIVVINWVVPARYSSADKVELSLENTLPQPEQRPISHLHPLQLPPEPVAVALNFQDWAPLRVTPTTLTGRDIRTGSTTYAVESPVRVIIGRPSLTPPQRPNTKRTLVQVAISLSPARALGLPKPAQRPVTLNATPTLVEAARPAQRPAALSTRTPTAIIQLAAATRDTRVSPQPSRSLFPRRSGDNPCSNRKAHEIPRRQGGASDGSAVMGNLEGASGSSRGDALAREALFGNVPAYLRNLQPVRFTGLAGGLQTEVTLCVTPDYLAIGSNSDNIRVPLDLPAALRIADAFNMILPTTRMVDAIYAQADLRVSPQPMTPGAQMSSTNYFVRHDAILDAQFSQAGARDGLLLAGHKKDLVLANRMVRAPGRVAIYGWHRSNGNPIQPLSTVHGEYYADYSHGTRLVSRTAYVNGNEVDVLALLTDGQYASMLNNDGPLSSNTIRLASLQ